jgi:predicted membrane-bound spermidine synthase
MPAANKSILYAIAFLIGFALMSYEILGVRVLSPYYGSSIYVWGAIISIFLSGLALGYEQGGKIADRIADLNVLRKIILIPALLITTFPVYGQPVCKLIYALELDSRASVLLLSIILFFIPCIFLGSVIPILVKMRAVDSQKIGSAAGDVYAMSTAGSITGTLVTSFFLISWLSVPKCFLLLGMFLIACWLLCVLFQLKSSKE